MEYQTHFSKQELRRDFFYIIDTEIFFKTKNNFSSFAKQKINLYYLIKKLPNIKYKNEDMNKYFHLFKFLYILLACDNCYNQYKSFGNICIKPIEDHDEFNMFVRYFNRCFPFLYLITSKSFQFFILKCDLFSKENSNYIHNINEYKSFMLKKDFLKSPKNINNFFKKFYHTITLFYYNPSIKKMCFNWQEVLKLQKLLNNNYKNHFYYVDENLNSPFKSFLSKLDFHHLFRSISLCDNSSKDSQYDKNKLKKFRNSFCYRYDKYIENSAIYINLSLENLYNIFFKLIIWHKMSFSNISNINNICCRTSSTQLCFNNITNYFIEQYYSVFNSKIIDKYSKIHTNTNYRMMILTNLNSIVYHDNSKQMCDNLQIENFKYEINQIYNLINPLSCLI